jgi:hypothetical protein
MAKLYEIREINSILSAKKAELSRKEAEFHKTCETLRSGAEPVGPNIADLRADIIRLLKDIANLNQQLSIKYLSLAAETKDIYEETDLVRTAGEFAKHAYEADQKAKSYGNIDSK